jgi:hypothetical protein
VAITVLGGYLILVFFKIKALKISQFSNKTDISYGYTCTPGLCKIT